MKLLLANPRGFCAGVDRAIEIVERALDRFGAPIHVRHEVVHNKYVVDSLRQRGAIFVEELDEVPADGTVIFSAHGVSQAVREDAGTRGLRVFDATCPLVTKVHVEVAACARDGRDCVLIGHRGHPEVEGTMGQYRSARGMIYLVEDEADARKLEVAQPDNLAYVTQTTLSMDDTARIVAILQARFPAIDGPRKDDICYATQNRQDAVKQLALECELVLVVGSPNSSNSTRLKELAERCGARAHLIDGAAEIDPLWLTGVTSIGLTAGASAPEKLVCDVVARLTELGVDEVSESAGIREGIRFSLPPGLR
ncbi:MAG: 4-hydroxy-3-methylbut-2-enyl diphosphate reductase [Gammaproteobacteria bacterium]|nr:4-hydroxy-3-methylbut-2-enyl diphosphate reductase [Gammaproteobacteria bacterium]